MKVKLKPADTAWAKEVKARDDYTCRRCHKSYPEGHRGIHAHHIFTRSRKSTRHDLLNGVTLCMGCHLWAHKNPLEAMEWFQTELGQAIFDELRFKSLNVIIRISGARKGATGG